VSPTIKDVAKRANVSIATVSLVLNHNPKISAETRHRVLKAIEELNYYPRRAARGLVSQRTGNIGFIATEDHFSRSEPFYTKIFLGTEFEARDHEYYILLTTISPEFSQNSNLPRFVLERNVDGIILAGKVPDKLVQEITRRKLPLVFVDYHPPFDNFPAVLIDNITGGFKATEELIKNGHTKIAFIGGDIRHPSIEDRFQGYKRALEHYNIALDMNLTVVDEDYPAIKNGYRAMQKLFDRGERFTAIFACNDAMALGALKFLKEKRIPIPEEISIIGFDDVEAALSVDPPLSTIRVNKEEMGIQSFRLMLEILESRMNMPRKVLVPVALIRRRSIALID